MTLEIQVLAWNRHKNTIEITVFIFILVYFVKATFNNISVILCQPVLLVKETEIPGKKH
jgi:hypothetical protein